MFDLDLIRSKNPIEDVVGEKFRLRKQGRYFKGIEHDSLVVNPDTGWYHWNSKHEQGSVIDFVMNHVLSNGTGSAFIEAVQYLAERAGIELPSQAELQKSPVWNEHQLVQRLQEALHNNDKALRYAVEQRGWTIETIYAAKLGFMPPNKEKLLKGLFLPNDWRAVIQRFPSDMLVYVHLEKERLTYLSGRSIQGKKHWNAPREFLGERRPYLNHCYRKTDKEIVIVEGQADAITFGQWELPAIAINGMEMSKQLLEHLIRQYRRVFIALDNTPDAKKISLEIARMIGPKACLPQYPDDVKDANEWLVKHDPEQQEVMERLNKSHSLIEYEVQQIQHLQGLERQDEIETLIDRAATWDKGDVSKLRQLMKNRLKMSMTLFTDLYKAARELRSGRDETSGGESQILGDDIPLISPALGFLPDAGMAVVTVTMLERTAENRLRLQPYLVTSKRELRRLGEEQVVPLNGHEAALRVIPEGSEFLQRWRYSDIQQFLNGEPVHPGEVFQQVNDIFSHYIDFNSTADSRIVSLWIIGTYFYTMFVAYPYLALNGPKNSGKSTVLNVAKPLAFNMITTSDITGPSLFRLIHYNSCTVGIDEAERYSHARDPEIMPIRLLLNSGYKPGMPAIRLIGDEMRPQAFDVYSPKILANIAGLEDVLASRCIPIPMRRSNRKMPIFPPTFDGSSIRHQLYTLALTRYVSVYRNYYERPELHKLLNRSHELWSPLVALAAFFEEEGGFDGLLASISEAAARDDLISEGKSLNDQDEALLKVLERMTHGHEVIGLSAKEIRKAVAAYLDRAEESLGSSQWIGHSLKQLHLTDNSRKHNPGTGIVYEISYLEVVDMMKRYYVAPIETEG